MKEQMVNREEILNWIKDNKSELIACGYVGLIVLYAYIVGYTKGKEVCYWFK